MQFEAVALGSHFQSPDTRVTDTALPRLPPFPPIGGPVALVLGLKQPAGP
jgi:hypothetical protein